MNGEGTQKAQKAQKGVSKNFSLLCLLCLLCSFPFMDHYVVRTTRLIAFDKRFQFSSSLSMCFRPARVSE
jgi:hypothetical protein